MYKINCEIIKVTRVTYALGVANGNKQILYVF